MALQVAVMCPTLLDASQLLLGGEEVAAIPAISFVPVEPPKPGEIRLVGLLVTEKTEDGSTKQRRLQVVLNTRNGKFTAREMT